MKSHRFGIAFHYVAMHVLLATLLLCCCQGEIINVKQSSTYENDDLYPVRFSAYLALLTSSGYDSWPICAVTALGQKVAWWMASLPDSNYYITRIEIKYRKNFEYRMAGFSVYITNTNSVTDPPTGHLCYKHTGSDLPNIFQDIDCYSLGKNIVIYNERLSEKPSSYSTEAILELCSITIYGCKKGWWNDNCNMRCPENCIDQQCFPTNGSCVLGCNWKNCKNDRCDKITNMCIDGCKEGITGDFCIAKTPYDCNFESPTEKVECNFESGTCGWIQDRTDDFDWTRTYGETGSSDTGPTNGHTFESATSNSNDYYIYIETSSPRTQDDKARLISIDIQPTGRSCVTFWYHMYGTNINTLNLYLKQNGRLGTPVWKHQGSLDKNQWYKAEVDISSPTIFQLVFEGVRGDGYKGDIALDDISYSYSSCQTTEIQEFCGWTQDKTDDFDWSKNKGSTKSSETGPTFDHTLKTGLGTYIYIETSGGNLKDTARIISSNISPTTGACVTFWYHMYGSHINTLNLYLKTNGRLPTLAWYHTGTLGDKWYMAQVDITSIHTFQLMFEGVRGSSYRGDIALDDITYSYSPCPQTTTTIKPINATTTGINGIVELQKQAKVDLKGTNVASSPQLLLPSQIIYRTLICGCIALIVYVVGTV